MDLKERCRRMVVAYTFDGEPVTAGQLKAHGSMALLLKDAIKPNLVQTTENTPAFVHGGPFANIAHGANSIVATRLGLKLADYMVTEAGFGADLGAEKFFDIVCRYGGFKPDAVVLVATIRALKHHGGVDKNRYSEPDLEALQKGLENLEKQVENIGKFGVPVVVAVNRFPADTEQEIKLVMKRCEAIGADAALSQVFTEGGAGGEELAVKVIAAAEKSSSFNFLYDLAQPIKAKVETICREIYGADGVDYTGDAEKMIQRLEDMGYRDLPICIAKTQYSLSDNADKRGRPRGFRVTAREVRLCAGAGFIVALAGSIMTMPGLSKRPAAEKIDILPDGQIVGLF
jgi:formate--tetrahydrofolate ligase